MEFDHIFFGDLSVELALEILLRTTVMYICTLALVRVLGKRGLGQLSTPVLLVRDGVGLTEASDREDLSQDELFMRLREKGVESLGNVRRAYLEPSGNVSVLTDESSPSPGESILPEE